MIAKSYINENLYSLDRLYNKSTGNKKKLYYSKLALLELCGWLEESMDDIALRSSSRVLKDASSKKYFSDRVVKRTFGFEYEKHFKNMIVSLIGLTGWEKLEKKIDTAVLITFKATLGNLKAMRNKEAHTHLKGTQRLVDAPSLTINNFEKLYKGLKEFEKRLKEMGY